MENYKGVQENQISKKPPTEKRPVMRAFGIIRNDWRIITRHAEIDFEKVTKMVKEMNEVVGDVWEENYSVFEIVVPEELR